MGRLSTVGDAYAQLKPDQLVHRVKNINLDPYYFFYNNLDLYYKLKGSTQTLNQHIGFGFGRQLVR